MRTRSMKRPCVAAQKRSSPCMPTEALINTGLKVSDGRANIHQVILISLLDLFLTNRYLLKLSADLQRVFLKLCWECSIGICRSWGGSSYKRWNNRRGGGTGVGSPTCILLRRVLLISIKGAMDLSPERTNFRSFRRQVMSIPKGRFLFGIKRCSDSIKSTMSLGILTLMLFRRQ